MSEISGAAIASTSTSSGAAAHRPGHGGSRQGPANLFSNLLSMASAGRQQTLADNLPAGSTDTPDATGASAQDNPLSDLLGWMDQAQDRNPLLAAASDGGALSSQQPATLLAPDALALAAPLQGLAPGASAGTQNDSTITANQSSAAEPLSAAFAPLTYGSTSAPAALASTLGDTRPEAPPMKTVGAATSRSAGPGVDITGMRPVAPGTTLTPAEAASLTAKHPGFGTTTTTSSPSTSALAPAPAPATSSVAWTATVPSQAVATPSLAPADAPANGESGPGRARALPHANRPSTNGGSATAQTAVAPSTAAPQKASADTVPVTPNALPTPASTSASSRSSPAAQDRAGKSMPSARSTVALDERFARTQAEAATVRDSRTEGLSPLASGLAGSDTSPQSRTDLAPPTSAAHATDMARGTDARDTGQPGLPSEAEPTSVSHWSTQHLRHASLRVGEGTQDAIDIQLSMDGQELNVDFRTDSAEARATLSQHADQSLGSLLERSGIQLGGVSVGAQHQQGQPPRETPQGTTPNTPLAPTGAGQDGDPVAPGAAPRGQLAARQDSSRPLDLFV
jgi:flagellar hook-length control protein FliK